MFYVPCKQSEQLILLWYPWFPGHNQLFTHSWNYSCFGVWPAMWKNLNCSHSARVKLEDGSQRSFFGILIQGLRNKADIKFCIWNKLLFTCVLNSCHDYSSPYMDDSENFPDHIHFFQLFRLMNLPFKMKIINWSQPSYILYNFKLKEEAELLFSNK